MEGLYRHGCIVIPLLTSTRIFEHLTFVVTDLSTIVLGGDGSCQRFSRNQSCWMYRHLIFHGPSNGSPSGHQASGLAQYEGMTIGYSSIGLASPGRPSR